MSSLIPYGEAHSMWPERHLAVNNDLGDESTPGELSSSPSPSAPHSHSLNHFQNPLPTWLINPLFIQSRVLIAGGALYSNCIAPHWFLWASVRMLVHRQSSQSLYWNWLERHRVSNLRCSVAFLKHWKWAFSSVFSKFLIEEKACFCLINLCILSSGVTF